MTARNAPELWVLSLFLAGIIRCVAQESYLFNATLRSNLQYGRPDATQEQIEAAARAAFMQQWISELPDAYDTVVGERGYRHSGGEARRSGRGRAGDTRHGASGECHAVDPDGDGAERDVTGRSAPLASRSGWRAGLKPAPTIRPPSAWGRGGPAWRRRTCLDCRW